MLVCATPLARFQAKKDDELKKAILDGVEKDKSRSFKSDLTGSRSTRSSPTSGRSRSSSEGSNVTAPKPAEHLEHPCELAVDSLGVHHLGGYA